MAKFVLEYYRQNENKIDDLIIHQVKCKYHLFGDFPEATDRPHSY